MFNVNDRVRIIVEGPFYGELGTVVLIDPDFGAGLHYVVDVDDNENDDPIVALITALYGVPSSSVPFAADNLELVAANA